MNILEQDASLAIMLTIVIATILIAGLLIWQVKRWRSWLARRESERTRAARLREQSWERSDGARLSFD